MTETMIRRLPDGKWQLTQRHDTLTSLMTALDSLADLGEQVQVEMPKAETWDGVYRPGDEGLTQGGFPYHVDRDNGCPPFRLSGRTTEHGKVIERTWKTSGIHAFEQDSELNLMPPTKRGPAV